MNKKILYKLLLIFALLACTLLISNTKSFAADQFTYTSDVYNSSYVENAGVTLQSVYDIIDNNQNAFTFTSSELPEYQVIVKIPVGTEENYYYQFISFSLPFHIYSPNIRDSNLPFRYKFTSSPYEYQKYVFLVTPTGFLTKSCGVSIINTTASSSITFENYGSSGYEIVNSNYDILNENDEVVFQQPPQVMEQVGTLAPIVEGVEAKKTLAEVVGILPVVLVVIVVLMAIRKAIRFLIRTLKQG